MLDEPRLEFRYRQRLPDPRDGLSIFGPCDCDEPSHPKSMTYAVIGPAEGVTAFEEWPRAMQRPAHFLLAGSRVCGRRPLASRRPSPLEWVATPVWRHVLDRTSVINTSRQQDPWERTFGVVNLYLNALEPLKKVNENINVVLCVIPAEVAADVDSASDTGRQWTMLQPYMRRSMSPPGAWNVSATFSSATRMQASGASVSRSERSTSAGWAISCSASSTTISQTVHGLRC